MCFNDNYCFANCLKKGKSVLVHSLRNKERGKRKGKLNLAYALIDVKHVTGRAAAKLASRSEYQAIWMYLEHFNALIKSVDNNEGNKHT
jgi:hypothetical protein